jgi:hypothetical protein
MATLGGRTAPRQRTVRLPDSARAAISEPIIDLGAGAPEETGFGWAPLTGGDAAMREPMAVVCGRHRSIHPVFTS